MEKRYQKMNRLGVRNIESYNEFVSEGLTKEQTQEILQKPLDDDLMEREGEKLDFLPYIVVVIDELADLMMSAKEVEQSIVRIAQKARAVGIHLILATQRPEAKVVTGLIKSNMPCRVAFKVSSGMDSRIVLDAKGAELLLGTGDMMYIDPSSTQVSRAQASFVSPKEIKNIVKHLKEVAAPNFERSLVQIKSIENTGNMDDLEERDNLFDESARVILESGRGSVSLLQRKFGIGYGRASRIIDQMEMAGIVGEHKGSVAREILITIEDWEQMQELEEDDSEN